MTKVKLILRFVHELVRQILSLENELKIYKTEENKF